MSATLSPAPLTFSQAQDALGSKSRRKIGHNTELVRDGEKIYATYHGNEIVEYSEAGVMATWAGWATSTTRDRLNKLTTGRFNIKNREPHINGQPVGWSDWVEIR
ncbi:hypothetical protein SEA_ATUIN_321 [Arthrobacter phage Atuin]|nr:hypothetical protein SEA_ATUIN_120 [Arthrobacter phage Atuin]